MRAQTLTQFLLDVNRGAAHHDFAHILSALAVSAKRTSALISRGALALDPSADRGVRGGAQLVRGVRRAARQILLEETADLRQLAAISFAGIPTIRAIAHRPDARYLLVVEPLHGAISLGENQPTGLVFSILERPTLDGPPSSEDFLQSGRQQVCAGMVLYGPSTMLVLTTGAGASGFTLDRDVGNFVLTHPRFEVPADSPLFAVNASEAPHWPQPVKRYVDECVRGADGPRGRDYVMRWNASAVLGVYRILLNGGLFLVPATERETGLWGVPLLHNAAPLSWIVEQAGGDASTGTQPILDVVPTSLTERVPLICGAADEVGRVERYHREHAGGLDTEPNYPLFHNRSLFAQQD